LSNGTIDLAYLSATDMLNAINQQTAEILLAGEIDGKTSYQSYWVTLKDKPYQSLTDLKGKPVAFSSKTSTSGYVIPLWDLRQKNLISDSGKAEEFFGAGNVWFGSGYVSAVERVLNGDAEAAAVSYYVLDKDKHLTAEQRQKLRRLAEQGPVPTHVIAIRSAISDADRVALRDVLLTMDKENTELRDRVFTSRLVEVDAAAHLSSLKESIALARRGSE
jgi:phosphonate transport system substrate-binding protein